MNAIYWFSTVLLFGTCLISAEYYLENGDGGPDYDYRRINKEGDDQKKESAFNDAMAKCMPKVENGQTPDQRLQADEIIVYGIFNTEVLWAEKYFESRWNSGTLTENDRELLPHGAIYFGHGPQGRPFHHVYGAACAFKGVISGYYLSSQASAMARMKDGSIRIVALARVGSIEEALVIEQAFTEGHGKTIQNRNAMMQHRTCSESDRRQIRNFVYERFSKDEVGAAASAVSLSSIPVLEQQAGFTFPWSISYKVVNIKTKGQDLRVERMEEPITSFDFAIHSPVHSIDFDFSNEENLNKLVEHFVESVNDFSSIGSGLYTLTAADTCNNIGAAILAKSKKTDRTLSSLIKIMVVELLKCKQKALEQQNGNVRGQAISMKTIYLSRHFYNSALGNFFFKLNYLLYAFNEDPNLRLDWMDWMVDRPKKVLQVPQGFPTMEIEYPKETDLDEDDAEDLEELEGDDMPQDKDDKINYDKDAGYDFDAVD